MDMEIDPNVVLTNKVKGQISKLRPSAKFLIGWNGLPEETKKKLIKFFADKGWVEHIESIGDSEWCIEYIAVEIHHNEKWLRTEIVYEAHLSNRGGKLIPYGEPKRQVESMIFDAMKELEQPLVCMVAVLAPSILRFDLPDYRKKYMLVSENIPVQHD